MPHVVPLYTLAGALLAAAPEERGAHAFTSYSAGNVDAAGASIPLTVYHPTDLTAPGPVVAVLHGFFRNGSFMAEMAQTIASRGMIALVPDMPCGLAGCDHDANAAQVSALLDWAIAQSGEAGSPLFGLVDGARLGVIGHSWGGLAVFLSAVRDVRINSVVMLDPNDDRGLAAGEASMMPHASLHVMAEVPGNCNSTNWGDTVFPSTPGPHLRVRVVGSGHCDAEEPTDNLCPVACGAGSAATTPYFRRYAVAWTECVLLGTSSEWIGGAELDADIAAGLLDRVERAGLEQLLCNGAVPADDAGVRDDARPVDDDAAAPAEDAASTGEDGDGVPGDPDAAVSPGEDAASAGGPDAGVSSMKVGGRRDDSGCSCSGAGARGDVFALLALFVWWVARGFTSESRRHQRTPRPRDLRVRDRRR